MTSTFYYKYTRGVKTSTIALFRNSIIAVMIALVVASPIVYAGSSLAFHTQYNLPLPSPLEHQPSHAIRIPFGAAGTGTGYDPANVSIPAGMTVVWFNDDSVEHTVTALTNESEQGGSSPIPVLEPILEPAIETLVPGGEQFDSGVIPPGGFSVFTFTKPGTYPYYDEFNTTHRGQINVGDLVGRGKSMDMRIGGDLPFNVSELGRIVLSFVPKNISLPPPLELTYNVTISDSNGPVYTREFGDIDGILDLEIIPVNKLNPSMQVGPGTNASNNTTSGNLANNTNAAASSAMSGSTIETTTYGPDLNSPITGTYHIEGPILVEPTPYLIKVEVTKIDGIAPSQPIVDEFTIPPEVGG
jgi:plastocyanin